MIDVDYIKDYLQDHPDKNILLDYTAQFEEDLIDIIIPMVYEEIFILYPSIGKQKDNIPNHVIMYGILHKLFESESFKELRNQVQYNDSNASVGLSVKNSDYIQKSELMRTQFLRLLESLAATNFMATAWGRTTSNASDLEYTPLNIGCWGWR
jgi:uncharacterized lipoprotein YddW (UPF0748 family)